MAQPLHDPFTDVHSNNDGDIYASKTNNSSTSLESDAAFHATPIFCPVNSPSKIEDSYGKANPTFIQNQISIQRSPSTTNEHASALSRKLSIKSNGSYSTPHSGLASVLSPNPEEPARGRERGDSNASMIEATNNCTLTKSSSERSAKSVRSLHALGSYPLGSLHVHSPSPTRASRSGSHEFLISGDVIVIRDVPFGSLLGYDTKAFIVKKGDNFQGIKDIPAGAHFIWGGSGISSLRKGFWIMSAKRASDEVGEIHVRRWDNYSEVLEEEISVAELRIQKAGIVEIFDKLQAYNISNSKLKDQVNGTKPSMSQALTKNPNVWHHLTSSMKGALLSKITGQEWNHWQVSSTHDCMPAGKLGSSLKDDSMDFRKDEVLNFVFPKALRTFSQTSIGRDRTEQAMDTSAHVMAVITGYCTYEDSDEIIGELQFCYVTGMSLGNVACMEQWAHIVKVVFKAFHLALDYPKFFLKFIEAVHAQLIYDHEGLEGSILDHDPSLPDELRMTLTVFKSRLNELLLAEGANLTPEQNDVGKAFEELESWLWKWNWDLRGNYVRTGKVQLEDGEFVDAELKDFEAEDERGEFAPAMVELDEQGRETGLIRF